MEEEMRRIVLSAAATFAVLAGAAMIPQSAEAMTLPAPAGIAAAAEGNNLAQDVAYVCRRVWRCGPYGCGWRRACYWTGPRRYWGPRYRYRRWHRW
jgi:hypothetical protein